MIVHFAWVAHAQNVFPTKKLPVGLQRAARIAVEIVERMVGSEERIVLGLYRDPAHPPERRNVRPRVVVPERIGVAIDDELRAANIERRIEAGYLLPFDPVGAGQIPAV